jgi:hypothetical protein
VCAKQAIELTWWTIKQLLAADNDSVVLAALRLIQSSKANMAIVEACRRLPLCSFATPKTWSVMHLHLRRPSQRAVNIVARLLYAATGPYMYHRPGGDIAKYHYICLCAGKREDMLLMRCFWQLADLHLCFMRLPTMLKVWLPAPAFVSLVLLLPLIHRAEGDHALALQQ